MGRLSGIARREAKHAAMQTLSSAEISAATGVAADLRGRPGKRQVTVLSSRAWQAACAELGKQLPWTLRRANLLVDELDLPQSAGAVIAIGGVRLQVTMEVAPCSRMEGQQAGLQKALTPDWRGGVACTVLQGGSVALGDDVDVLDAD